MIKNYLLITFRNLVKNRLFVIINLIGLSIALAFCIVAYLNWEFNADFDTQYRNTAKIYRVNFTRITNGQSIKNGDCPMPLAGIIKTNFGQVKKVVRVYPVDGNFKIGDELFRTSVSCADSGYFNLFNYNWISGNPEGLTDKSKIFISSELAKKHFGNNPDPVGQMITYIKGDQRVEFMVGGVFQKPPLNSSFQAEAYVNFDNLFDVQKWDENDWSLFNSTFIEVENAKDVGGIETKLQQYVEIQNKAKEDYKVDHYYLDPFKGMAQRAQKERIWNHWFNYSLPVSEAIAPSIMAILLLLLACFNFTNTSIAIANKRIKEIGIRKVLGSSRKQLIAQFLGENILLSLVALILGIILASELVPAYSSLWTFLDIKLNLLENAGLLVFLVILLILTGSIAGSYPAFYVSSFQAASVLKGTHKFSGTNNFTRILLTTQFAISIVAVITGIIFSQNAQYQKNYNIGFDTRAVVIASFNDAKDYRTFKNELTGNSSVSMISGSANSVASSWYTDPIKFESVELDADMLDIGDDYLKTIGATILNGRDFIKDSKSDIENSVIVNRELVKTFGWKDPIGKRIMIKDSITLYVVGVVQDLYLDGGLWNPVKPLVLRYIPEEKYRFISVRTSNSDLVKVHDFMESKWKVIFPDILPTVSYLDKYKAQALEINNNIMLVFIILGITALILSITGLFSLVSLNIIKRTKEIGVRKVLGASIPRIIKNISSEFFIILSIALLIGSVTGYYVTSIMMGSIWAYYVPIGPFPFVLSISILYLLSALTVGGKIIQAASLNPAKSLRSE